MSVSAVTKSGSSRFRGTLYDYIRDSKFSANDRSNSIAGTDKPKDTYQYPGGNVGGPIIIPGWDFTKNRDKLFFFVGYEYQKQNVDTGSRFDVGADRGHEARRLQRVAGRQRPEPEHAARR